jgi:hypothetical protein
MKVTYLEDMEEIRLSPFEDAGMGVSFRRNFVSYLVQISSIRQMLFLLQVSTLAVTTRKDMMCLYDLNERRAIYDGICGEYLS